MRKLILFLSKLVLVLFLAVIAGTLLGLFTVLLMFVAKLLAPIIFIGIIVIFILFMLWGLFC